jgi:hypothetical protein
VRSLKVSLRLHDAGNKSGCTQPHVFHAFASVPAYR